MKIKLLTVLMAALFSANSVSAADAPTGNGAPQQTAPAVPGGDIAQWQQASSGLPVNQQSQVQQPPQQTAQEQGQQQAQGQQPQAQAQQQPTTALPPAPMPQIPPPQQQVTHVNPQTLEELPAPVLQQIQPITPGQVRSARSAMEDMSAAAKTSPLTPIPRISSQTVSLSVGASIPQVRVFPNQATTVTFSDATGHPWVLGAPPYNSSPCASGGELCVGYIPGSAVFTIQPTNAYASGNITVLLKGLATPVIINVKGAEPSVKSKTVDVDYRLDLRIPKRSPDTPVYTATPEKKISLYDKQLQSVLDGIPPEDAQRLKLKNAPGSTKVWQIGDELYVRSNMQLQDEFEKTLSAIDGTHVYVLPATPVLTFSVNGQARDVEVELN